MSSLAHHHHRHHDDDDDTVFLGMDVHKDSISVGVLNPGYEIPDVEKIFNDEELSVRRLIGRFGEPGLLRACYEAGPTGYETAAASSLVVGVGE